LDERVPPIQELHKEEALAILARKYFRSHSPASLKDFVGTFIKYYKISQLIHTQSIAN